MMHGLCSREERMLIAGAGGQGVMLLGSIIAQAVVSENKNVTYIRSYGSEMRGGTAHCMIKISSEEISSPVFANATIAIIMNNPSLNKFKDKFAKGAVVVADSIAAKSYCPKKRVRIVFYPFNALAHSLGDAKMVNIIALGALLREYNLVKKSSVDKIIKNWFKDRPYIAKQNLKALATGWNLVK